MARALVSKTSGWGFESLHSCSFKTFKELKVKNKPKYVVSAFFTLFLEFF